MTNALSRLVLCALTTGDGDYVELQRLMASQGQWFSYKLVIVLLLFLWTAGPKNCKIFECITSILRCIVVWY